MPRADSIMKRTTEAAFRIRLCIMGTPVRSANMIIVILAIMFMAVARCEEATPLAQTPTAPKDPPFPPPPTAPEIIKQAVFHEAVGKAWHESYVKKGIYQIRGGWVYADVKNPTHLFVRLTNKDRSVPFPPRVAEKQPEKVEIYLDYPENDGTPPLPPPGFNLVADFHTHPFPGVYLTPDEGDVYRAFNRDVPGIVYSQKGIFIYGPPHRPSWAGPPGYPGNRRILPPKGQPLFTFYGPNPFPPLP